MTVKEIFDLRKQGHIEEAYEAIRPMYAAHKGRYTSLCMFWTASDVFKLRLEQDRVEEATKILQALKRMQSRIEEITKELDSQKSETRPDDAKLPWETNDSKSNSSAAYRFIDYAERRLKAINSCSKQTEGFSNRFSSDFEAQGPTPEKEDSSDSSDSCSEKDNISALSASQTQVLDCIRTTPGLRVPALSDLTGIPAKSIERHISALIERSLIEHRGSKKSGGYYAL